MGGKYLGATMFATRKNIELILLVTILLNDLLVFQNTFSTRRESEPFHLLPCLPAHTEQQHVWATRPYLRWMFNKHF